MKTKIILIFSILSMVISACQKKIDSVSWGTKLLAKEITLPNDRKGFLVVSVSGDQGTYRIDFLTDDKKSLIRFYQETHFITGYVSYCEDSLLAHLEEIHTSSPMPYIVNKFGEHTWEPLKHHTTIDVLAKTEFSNEPFQPLAKVEFIVDNDENPTRIETIIIWEAQETFTNKKIN